MSESKGQFTDVVRPIIAIGFTAMIGYLVYTSKISSSVIVALVGPMIGFYFGEKKREV